MAPIAASIPIGAPALHLTLRDVAGSPVALDDLAGGRSLVLYFMRTSDCVVCKRHVRQLAIRHDDLRRRGASVAVVVPDSSQAAGELQASLSLPFPVVSGADGDAHAAAGLGRAVFGRLQRSGTILLDPDGTVRHVTSSTLPLGALDEQALLDDLDAIPERASL